MLHGSDDREVTHVETKKPIFLSMPAWQGSAESRAMLLADGAEHLRADLPPTERFDVPIPSHAGDALGTPVARLSSVLAARDSTRKLLRQQMRPAITVGGDCSSTIAGLEHAAQHYPGLAVLWFDAQPDLQDPLTSPTGAASRMALRHALGEGVADLASLHPVDPARVLLIGTRDIDPDEGDAITTLKIKSSLALDPAAEVEEWLASSGATHLYIHIDLDVLDPAEFSSVHSAVPFGLSVTDLTATIKLAVRSVPLVGAAICEFAPADESIASDDAPTVLRILGALTSGKTV